jgi:hypothetical protein
MRQPVRLLAGACALALAAPLAQAQSPAQAQGSSAQSQTQAQPSAQAQTPAPAPTRTESRPGSWAEPAYPDPLRWSSLPLDAAEADTPPAGEWWVSASAAYFNVWQVSWQTPRVHRELGLEGQPLLPSEVDLLVARGQSADMYHIDMEGVRTDLVAAWGLGHGWALHLRAPFVEIGSPSWDAIPERFHSTFGVTQAERDVFPRGQATVVVAGQHGLVERWDEEVRGSGLGDVEVAVSATAGRFAGAEHRFVLAVEAPTGDAGTLFGSGGWDWGARWFATWPLWHGRARIGAGYTWLDRSGSWLGLERDDTWHAFAEATEPVSRSLALRLSVRMDSSPLASFTHSEVGDGALYWLLGLKGELSGGTWWTFDLGQNYPGKAEAPDFSLHLGVGATFGGSPR